MLFPVAAWGAALTCPGTEVVVEGGNPADRALACAGVAEGLPILQSLGLGLAGPLAIELTASGPEARDAHEVGHYDRRSNTISMLGYESARIGEQVKPSALGIRWSPALWKSYLVHEMAHASVCRRDPERRVTLGQHEYVAAVVQLSAMSAPDRERVLAHHADATGFDDPRQLGEIYYFMAPGRYAVQSYLHFLKPENGTAFIRGLLPAGERSPDCR